MWYLECSIALTSPTMVVIDTQTLIREIYFALILLMERNKMETIFFFFFANRRWKQMINS